jgi:hypothetical protein
MDIQAHWQTNKNQQISFQVPTQNFFWGRGADPQAIYNLYLILQIM